MFWIDGIIMEVKYTHRSILKLLPSNLWLFEFAFVWNMQKILYLWPKNKHCFYAVTSIEFFFLSHFHALSWLNKVFSIFSFLCFFCTDIHNWTLYMCISTIFFVLKKKKLRTKIFFYSHALSCIIIAKTFFFLQDFWYKMSALDLCTYICVLTQACSSREKICRCLKNLWLNSNGAFIKCFKDLVWG